MAAAGAAVVDADDVARELTGRGGHAIPLLKREFGQALIDSSGALDRDAMRSLVFNDSSARKRLEAILHPLVGATMEARARQAHRNGKVLIIFDIPLLVESKRWPSQLDAVVVVDCSEQTQIERVMHRNGLTSDAVRAIMAAQARRSSRLAAADAVVFNDGIDLQELKILAEQLARQFGL